MVATTEGFHGTFTNNHHNYNRCNVAMVEVPQEDVTDKYSCGVGFARPVKTSGWEALSSHQIYSCILKQKVHNYVL